MTTQVKETNFLNLSPAPRVFAVAVHVVSPQFYTQFELPLYYGQCRSTVTRTVLRLSSLLALLYYFGERATGPPYW